MWYHIRDRKCHEPVVRKRKDDFNIMLSRGSDDVVQSLQSLGTGIQSPFCAVPHLCRITCQYGATKANIRYVSPGNMSDPTPELQEAR